jgi:hypothetical protein
MNVALAILWFLGGVALIAWHSYTGEQGWRLRIGDYPLSPGWLMLLLAVYNLVRWWGLRSIRAEQRAFRLALDSAHRRHFRDRPDSERIIDPTFDFTREPPPDPNVTDRPPAPG